MNVLRSTRLDGSDIRRARFAFAGILCLLLIGMTAGLPSVAHAEVGARDFCQNYKLQPANTCSPSGSSEPYFYEGESWNSTGEGVGSCVGILLEVVPNWTCTGDGGTYDEVYCKSSCEGETGWAVAHDHSATKASNFTGWGKYNTKTPGALASLGDTSALLSQSAAPLPLEVGGPPDPVPATTPRQMVETVDTAESSAFSVMDRPQVAGDIVPTDELIAFSANSGANPGLARHVTTSAGNAWLVPGDGDICLIGESVTTAGQGGAACGPDTQAVAGKLALESTSTHNPGAAFVAGLAPNGVTSVTLLTKSGDQYSAAVKDNVYMVEVPAWVTQVTADDSSPDTVVMSEP